MEFDVYAIKDLEKGEFAQPFFVPIGTSVESVKINFKRLIEKGDSEVSYFPERFELHDIGSFDSLVGELCPNTCANGTLVAKGIDFARPEYVKALAQVKANMEDNEE